MRTFSPTKSISTPALEGGIHSTFNQTVDDRPYKANQNYDIGLRVLTPW